MKTSIDEALTSDIHFEQAGFRIPFPGVGFRKKNLEWMIGRWQSG